MKRLALVLLLAARFAQARNGDCSSPNCNQPEPENVNSRYTVESVDFAGNVHSRDALSRLSGELREDIQKLIGQKFNESIVNKLAKRVRDELKATTVSAKVERGTQPEHIRVVFETKRRRLEEEASIPKLAYHSLQGWTGALEVKTNVGSNNDLVVGVQSDGDSLVERQAGINMRLSHAIGE